MKVRPSVKKICEKCKVIKRKGEHLFFSLLFISLIILIGIFSEVSLLGINVYFLLLAPFILYDPFIKEN